VLNGMGEAGGSVELTVEASQTSAWTLVPFARALRCLTHGEEEWHVP